MTTRDTKVSDHVARTAIVRFALLETGALNLIFALGRWYTLDTYHWFWYHALINSGVYIFLIAIPMILLLVYLLVGDKAVYKIVSILLVVVALAIEFMVLDDDTRVDY